MAAARSRACGGCRIPSPFGRRWREAPDEGRALLLAADAETAEAGVEARQSATAIDELLRAAGPGRMGVRVNVQMQRRAFLAPGRAGDELDAIGHDDLDRVVIRVDVGLHREVSGGTSKEPSGGPAALSVGGPITRATRPRKSLRSAAGRLRARGEMTRERALKATLALSGRLDL